MSNKFQVRDLRNGNWFWINKQALKIIADNIGAKGIAVYNCLCYFATNQAEFCFPSLNTLATMCHFSTRTVMRVLKELRGLGIINIEYNRGQVNTYTLLKCVAPVTSDTRDRGGSDRRDRGVVTGETPEQELTNKKETPSLLSLRSRYPAQDLIDQVFKAIASTRKSNNVSESVLIAQLQKWERYPVNQVEAGIRTYLSKDYASQGKGEAYLLGIIRNHDSKSEPRRRYAT